MLCSTFFQFFVSFNLRNYIFQSAKMCEMTSLCMTSLHVYVNEAAKCIDIIPSTLLASLSRLRTFVQNTKWGQYLAYLTKNNHRIYESSRRDNLERAHGWCSAVGKVAF